MEQSEREILFSLKGRFCMRYRRSIFKFKFALHTCKLVTKNQFLNRVSKRYRVVNYIQNRRQLLV